MSLLSRGSDIIGKFCGATHHFATARRRDGVVLDDGDVGCERRWRAVDQDGNVLVRSRRNALAAKLFFRKPLKRLEYPEGP